MEADEDEDIEDHGANSQVSIFITVEAETMTLIPHAHHISALLI